MTPLSPQECRERLSELVQEAIPEEDPDRRTALLVMADHWAELLRSRSRSQRVSSGRC